MFRKKLHGRGLIVVVIHASRCITESARILSTVTSYAQLAYISERKRKGKSARHGGHRQTVQHKSLLHKGRALRRSGCRKK